MNAAFTGVDCPPQSLTKEVQSQFLLLLLMSLLPFTITIVSASGANSFSVRVPSSHFTAWTVSSILICTHHVVHLIASPSSLAARHDVVTGYPTTFLFDFPCLDPRFLVSFNLSLRTDTARARRVRDKGDQTRPLKPREIDIRLPPFVFSHSYLACSQTQCLLACSPHSHCLSPSYSADSYPTHS